MSRTKAHDAKIYGIDWSNTHRDKLITCSLDMSIKVWFTNSLHSTDLPSQSFRAEHPVWRARDLPFGHGFLSLPQRGENGPGLWTYNNTRPIETFEGHSDVVKEFVWRSQPSSKDDHGDIVHLILSYSPHILQVKKFN